MIACSFYSICPGVLASCLLFLACFVRSSRLDPDFNEQLILRDVVSDIVLRTTVTNAGPDTAYNVLLVFTHPTVLSYSRVDGDGQFTCTPDQSAGVTTCTVASVLGNQTQVRMPHVSAMQNMILYAVGEWCCSCTEPSRAHLSPSRC